MADLLYVLVAGLTTAPLDSAASKVWLLPKSKDQREERGVKGREAQLAQPVKHAQPCLEHGLLPHLRDSGRPSSLTCQAPLTGWLTVDTQGDAPRARGGLGNLENHPL